MGLCNHYRDQRAAGPPSKMSTCQYQHRSPETLSPKGSIQVVTLYRDKIAHCLLISRGPIISYKGLDSRCVFSLLSHTDHIAATLSLA